MKMVHLCLRAVALLLLGGNLCLLVVLYVALFPDPLSGLRFACAFEWITTPFHRSQAGFALDQPTVGKSFFWVSILSFLNATSLLLLGRLTLRSRGFVCRLTAATEKISLAALLVAWLVPLGLVAQYAVSMGITPFRLAGIFVGCAAIGLTLVSGLLTRGGESRTRDSGRWLLALLLLSLVVPACYVKTDPAEFLPPLSLLLLSGVYATVFARLPVASGSQ